MQYEKRLIHDGPRAFRRASAIRCVAEGAAVNDENSVVPAKALAQIAEHSDANGVTAAYMISMHTNYSLASYCIRKTQSASFVCIYAHQQTVAMERYVYIHPDTTVIVIRYDHSLIEHVLPSQHRLFMHLRSRHYLPTSRLERGQPTYQADCLPTGPPDTV